MNTDTLQGFLTWILTPGAGVLAYWLMEEIKFLREFGDKYKRYSAFILSAILAMLAYLSSVFMGYVEQPETWRIWIESLFSVAMIAAGVGQLLHGTIKLK